MSIGKPESQTQAQFLMRVEQARCPTDYKVYVYEAIRQEPIALYFTLVHFKSSPESVKRGTMLKSRGLFSKKKLFIVLSVFESCLKVFTDEKCPEQSEEITLYNTTVKFVPAKEKKPAKLVIASRDGADFGPTFKKGLKRPANKSQYEFSKPKEDAELRQWVEYLNFAALYITLIQMTTHLPKLH
jgi:hypothetical protein